MKKNSLSIITVSLLLLAGCGDEVKMVELSPVSITFKKITQSETLEAKALDMRDQKVDGVSFTWTSENSAVATVTSNGVVKPIGDGFTAIVAKTAQGVEGITNVKVCLPKELKCDPVDELKLKVGTTGPIRCEVTDCKDEKVNAKIEFIVTSEAIAKSYEEPHVFVGMTPGDTTVLIKAFNLEKTVKIHVDEQTFLPGMAPGSGGGGGGGGGGGRKKASKDPYDGKSGRFDHILGNMKF